MFVQTKIRLNTIKSSHVKINSLNNLHKKVSLNSLNFRYIKTYIKIIVLKSRMQNLKQFVIAIDLDFEQII